MYIHIMLYNNDDETGTKSVAGQDIKWKKNWFGLSIWLLDTPKIYVRYNILII